MSNEFLNRSSKPTAVIFDNKDGLELANVLRVRGFRCFLFKTLKEIENHVNVKHDNIDFLIIGEGASYSDIKGVQHTFFPLAIKDCIVNLLKGYKFKTAFYSYLSNCVYDGNPIDYNTAKKMCKENGIKVIDRSDDNASQILYDFLEFF